MSSQPNGQRSSAQRSSSRSSSTAHAPARKAATGAKPAQQVRSATATATKPKPGLKPAARPVVRGTTAERLGKREVRAALRAAQRRRRNTIVSSIAAALVVLALFLLLKDRLPRPGGSTKSATGANACAATPTSVIGPAVALTPAPTPPALPSGAKTVNGDQGLQYVDISVGCGRTVQAGDNVLVNYTGWLQSSGKEFDSSIGAGKTPFEVDNVGQAQVISGWNLGLQGMKLGGTRRLIIPASLGYGAQGSPPVIPPNATLIFDVTIVGFK